MKSILISIRPKWVEEMANGYYIENNKIVYFSNMLDGYKDEKTLQEVCDELNNFIKIFDSYCAKIDFLENKNKELEKQLKQKSRAGRQTPAKE